MSEFLAAYRVSRDVTLARCVQVMGVMLLAFLLVTFSLSRSALTLSQCSDSAVILTGRPVQALLQCYRVYVCMSIEGEPCDAVTVRASHAAGTPKGSVANPILLSTKPYVMEGATF